MALSVSDDTGLAVALSQSTIDGASRLIIELLRNDLLYDTIFTFCSPKTLLLFSRVCYAAKTAVTAYFRRAFNINRHLLRFFNDVLSFRALQSRTGTLISGSMALQFLDRSFYAESDLDLYVHMRWRHEVGRWLLAAGYAFTPNSSQNSDFETAASDPRVTARDSIYIMRGVSAVFTFHKTSGDGDKELKVQLIVATHTPIEIILCFHSTCVMNVISYNKAVALYPEATFEQRRSLVCATNGSLQDTAIEKYQSRGWDMMFEMPAAERAEERKGAFRIGRRWLEDGDSWVIRLDTVNIPPPPANSPTSVPLMEDPVVFTSWKLSLDGDFGGTVDFNHLTTFGLFYGYLIDDDEIETAIDNVLLIRVAQAARASSGPLNPMHYDRAYHSLRPDSTFFDASVLAVGTALLKEQKLVGQRC